jgi:hypothetical protein
MLYKKHRNIVFFLMSIVASIPAHGMTRLGDLWRTYGPSETTRPSQVRETLLQEELNKINLLAYLQELAQQKGANITERNPFFIEEYPSTVRKMVRPYETSRWGRDLSTLMNDIAEQRATQEQRSQRFAKIQRQLRNENLLRRLAAQSGYSQQFDMF